MSNLKNHAVLINDTEFLVSTENQAGTYPIRLKAGTMMKFDGDEVFRNKMIRAKIFNEKAMKRFNQDNILLYCTWNDNVRDVSKIIWEMAIAIEDRWCRLNFITSRRSADAERLSLKKSEQIMVKGTDHIVNGIFVGSMYKVQRMLGKPGLHFIVKISQCLRGNVPDNAKQLPFLRQNLPNSDLSNVLVVTADYIYPAEPTHSIETELNVEVENMTEQTKMLYSSIMKPSSTTGSELPINKSSGPSRETTKASADTKTFRGSVGMTDDHTAMSSTYNDSTKQNIPRNHSNDSTTMKNTIYNVDNKPVYVIDKEQIDESTKNNKVIVIDPHGSNDLCDQLGSNWPASAGAAGDVLNSDRSSTVVEANKRTGLQRNKSPNILNHINSSSSKRTSNGSTYASQKDPHVPPYDNVAFPQLPKTEIVPATEYAVIPNTSLEVGCMIQVSSAVLETDLHGVIKWIGIPPGGGHLVIVGVELEDFIIDAPIDVSDGTYNGHRLFKCSAGRGIFVRPDQCSYDLRFGDCEVAVPVTKDNAKQMFGGLDCPAVLGRIPPIKIENINDLQAICGTFKGIQGHHNSCYLDATLFSMFAFTNVFDALIYRERNSNDSDHYDSVKTVLRDEIVNPLRKNTFVRADRVLRLREMLEETCSIKGLTSEEKDPEEFINILLAETLKAEPFLKLNSGQEAFCYQLFVDKDERLSFPTVQQLFDQSFLSSDIKLQEVPSCLIIQMPRFGKNFKMYPRILPSSLLDVTDVIEDSPRQCMTCGQVACFECKDCFVNSTEAISYCAGCYKTAHNHAKRHNHTSKPITYPSEFRHDQPVPRIYMELFAVVCIETSHYVSFVKAGSGSSAPWSFFDSMADRKGGQGGYNIPEMVSVPDLPDWITDAGSKTLHDGAVNDKQLPELAKRLLCDAYLCMYQSRDVKMYK